MVHQSETTTLKQAGKASQLECKLQPVQLTGSYIEYSRISKKACTIM
uniref:Uncharacterized protein n=1 Tax=Anguilla anguilla TaxID=7936 RepID=A0A0E9U5A1_ANGAN